VLPIGDMPRSGQPPNILESPLLQTWLPYTWKYNVMKMSIARGRGFPIDVKKAYQFQKEEQKLIEE
jgi:hypothetical protein